MIIVPPTITPRPRGELSTFVLESIQAAGIRVPESSRLRRIHDLYNSGTDIVEPDQPEYEIALEGERDMQLLGFVFDQCNSDAPTEAFRRLLKKLVRDSVLPQSDREHSPGRDAFFELFVGTVCKAAHLEPVVWGEPDVVCTLDAVQYAFEAKRIKSIKSLEHRIRKAVNQIGRSRLPGIVVLDVGLAFNPGNRRITDMPDSVFWSQYEKHFRRTLSDHFDKIQKLLSPGYAIGVVIHDYHVRQVGRNWQLAGTTIRMPSLSKPSDERRLFEKLSLLYVYGLPNQSDASHIPLVIAKTELA